MSDSLRSDTVGNRMNCAVDAADADVRGRAVERHARQRQGRRAADAREDVRVDLGIGGDDGREDLDLVAEAVREERADGAVDEAAREHLLVGRARLALEEAAGERARGREALAVVYREREEGLALADVGVHDGRVERHRVAERGDDGAVGLAGELARLEGDRLSADVDRLGNRVRSAHRKVGVEQARSSRRLRWCPPLPCVGPLRRMARGGRESVLARPPAVRRAEARAGWRERIAVGEGGRSVRPGPRDAGLENGAAAAPEGVAAARTPSGAGRARRSGRGSARCRGRGGRRAGAGAGRPS